MFGVKGAFEPEFKTSSFSSSDTPDLTSHGANGNGGLILCICITSRLVTVRDAGVKVNIITVWFGKNLDLLRVVSGRTGFVINITPVLLGNLVCKMRFV